MKVRFTRPAQADLEAIHAYVSERNPSAAARLVTRLIEGEFPNYRQLIPSGYPNRLTVGREALLVRAWHEVTLAGDHQLPVLVEDLPGGGDQPGQRRDSAASLAAALMHERLSPSRFR